MNLDTAHTAARSILDQIRGVVRAGEIAGSIRRGKPDVGDIDLVVCPTLEAGLSRCIPWSWSDDFLAALRNPARTFYIENKARSSSRRIVLRSRRRDDVKAELWCCEPEVLGWLLAIRTGPADFAAALMVVARARGFTPRVSAGCYFAEGDRSPIPMRRELDVFTTLEIGPVIPPAHRSGRALYEAAGIDADRADELAREAIAGDEDADPAWLGGEGEAAAA